MLLTRRLEFHIFQEYIPCENEFWMNDVSVGLSFTELSQRISGKINSHQAICSWQSWTCNRSNQKGFIQAPCIGFYHQMKLLLLQASWSYWKQRHRVLYTGDAAWGTETKPPSQQIQHFYVSTMFQNFKLGYLLYPFVYHCRWSRFESLLQCSTQCCFV